jgi:hypothetical protein
MFWDEDYSQGIHNVINHNIARHSRESGNPGKHWIPGQARNDKPVKIYVVMYKRREKWLKNLTRKRSFVLSARRQNSKGCCSRVGKADRIFGYAPGAYLCSFMEADI